MVAYGQRLRRDLLVITEAAMESGDLLKGGNSNRVVRDGDTVLRGTGPWSPFVHELLRYLTASGFEESPVLLEATEAQERLSFRDGDVGNYPLPRFVQTDVVLIEAARLLRRFHDLTQHFIIPADSIFRQALRADVVHEVICHNDFAPYNCVFEHGRLVGIIDFDTAAPGSRLWDIAYAAYRFAPLTSDANCVRSGWEPIPDRAARLKLFCDAYGLEDRTRLMATVPERLEALVADMRRTASNLEHIPIYLDDLEYLKNHQATFAAVLLT